ncbi:MAG TPA: hypothetical protein VHO67_10415 [Polyangia bacterium]|nr:hypothetical protein [Polyangia bacterium]
MTFSGVGAEKQAVQFSGKAHAGTTSAAAARSTATRSSADPDLLEAPGTIGFDEVDVDMTVVVSPDLELGHVVRELLSLASAPKVGCFVSRLKELDSFNPVLSVRRHSTGHRLLVVLGFRCEARIRNDVVPVTVQIGRQEVHGVP